MKGKYCLVYWTETKEISVLLTKDIPTKKRQEGVSTKLLWKDATTNKATLWDAKILRFHDDPIFLNNLEVQRKNGTVINSKPKAFTQKAFLQKRRLAKQRAKRRASVDYDHQKEITQQLPMFDNSSFIPTSLSSQIPHDQRIPMTNGHRISHNGQLSPAPQSNGRSDNAAQEMPSTSSIMIARELPIMAYQKEKLHQHQVKRESFDGENSIIESSEDGNSEDRGSDDEARCSRRQNGHNQSFGCDWFYGMRPPTREVIAYLKAMVQHLEMMREAEENKAMERIKEFYDEAHTCGMGKMEIHPESNVFIDKQTMTLAMEDFNHNHDWKQLTINLLVGIYHDTLEYMSVEESEGKIQVPEDILRAVKEVIDTRGSADKLIHVDDEVFIKHVRKICTNHKRHSYNH
ncbi:uncharacterized protein LOC135160711 [Diachasmimorpha longicaudata]|uniref:uncharacterized protein LOC135160711 n=1 Tax=Diachasmimorpha longicaudata TaxID=58733 RepID=UPI0030B889C5